MPRTVEELEREIEAMKVEHARDLEEAVKIVMAETVALSDICRSLANMTKAPSEQSIQENLTKVKNTYTSILPWLDRAKALTLSWHTSQEEKKNGL